MKGTGGLPVRPSVRPSVSQLTDNTLRAKDYNTVCRSRVIDLLRIIALEYNTFLFYLLAPNTLFTRN